MTGEPEFQAQRRPKVTIALADCELRRRLLAVLGAADVDVEVIDTAGLAQSVQEAEGDVLLVGPNEVAAVAPELLDDLVGGDEEVAVAVIGEDDPAERARLLAAGFSGVLSGDASEAALAENVEAIAEAEAAGGLSGPEVGGVEARPRLADFLTRSPRMREFVELVQRVTSVDSSLLILGPTGVGKEHLARAIHYESHRAEGPFVAVNCAALPEQLLEAELFGHVKGAFTGADRPRKGHFELAHGGTVFLDEVGEMPPHLQAKLLTVLQRREITPVGSGQTVRVDVRVMVATNRDLEQEVASGRFREDLFFRLNVVPLQIPPLAERPEDIPDLAGRFIQHFRGTLPVSEVVSISDAAVAALMTYSWPGNVRELINVIERAMLLSRGSEINLEDLPPAIAHGDPGARATTTSEDPLVATPEEWLGLSLREVRELAIRRAESAYLRAMLTRTKGHLAKTAGEVGLSPRALYERMKRYDLRKEDFKE